MVGWVAEVRNRSCLEIEPDEINVLLSSYIVFPVQPVMIHDEFVICAGSLRRRDSRYRNTDVVVVHVLSHRKNPRWCEIRNDNFGFFQEQVWNARLQL